MSLNHVIEAKRERLEAGVGRSERGSISPLPGEDVLGRVESFPCFSPPAPPQARSSGDTGSWLPAASPGVHLLRNLRVGDATFCLYHKFASFKPWRFLKLMGVVFASSDQGEGRPERTPSRESQGGARRDGRGCGRGVLSAWGCAWPPAGGCGSGGGAGQAARGLAVAAGDVRIPRPQRQPGSARRSRLECARQ